MSKTGLIIKREFMTRVKKRSFLIMTILGPLLFAALMCKKSQQDRSTLQIVKPSQRPSEETVECKHCQKLVSKEETSAAAAELAGKSSSSLLNILIVVAKSSQTCVISCIEG